MLRTVTSITRLYPATLVVAFLSLLFQTAYNFLFIFTVIGCYQVYYPGPQDSATRLNVVVVFLIFSFYWTTQVIFYVTHTTVAGVFASYYFLTGLGQQAPRNPTAASFRRAMTTSFGSICFGALFVAVLNLIRALLYDAQQQVDTPCAAFVLCLVQCCLGYIQALLEYFNYYAYTQVAIYGKDFCTAAKDTWTLIKDRGIEAIINDNLTGGILTGVLTALFGYLYLVITRPAYNAGGNLTPVLVLISFLLGISMFGTVATVIQSGVATTFVCLAEDPEALRRTKPELYEMVRSNPFV
ncbi:choline transporter-like protein, partial [Jimgerdemannia flammicorona]